MNKTIKLNERIDSNTCRICGGEAKQSKAIQNYHNIRKSFRRGEIEFETSIIQCKKCTNCGHSWN
jgi:predicted Zn-ribbon and HTH transcriptional regulator